jgi:hypothetical protein
MLMRQTNTGEWAHLFDGFGGGPGTTNGHSGVVLLQEIRGQLAIGGTYNTYGDELLEF